MNRFIIYELIEFLVWLKPVLGVIERNGYFHDQREEAFQIIRDRIKVLIDQIEYTYDMQTPAANPGEIQWCSELHELEDTREDNGGTQEL